MTACAPAQLTGAAVKHKIVKLKEIFGHLFRSRILPTPRASVYARRDASTSSDRV